MDGGYLELDSCNFLGAFEPLVALLDSIRAQNSTDGASSDGRRLQGLNEAEDAMELGGKSRSLAQAGYANGDRDTSSSMFEGQGVIRVVQGTFNVACEVRCVQIS